MFISRLFALDEVSALTGIGLLCCSYLLAYRLARIAWAVRRRGGGSSIQCPRVAWVARLLGSVGVVLSCVSPVAAMGANGGGRPVGASRQTGAPPWDSAASHENASKSRAGGPSADRPWESGRHLLRPTPEAPRRSAESSAPPWSGDDGSSPPRPLRRTGAAADSPRNAPEDGPGARREPDHESAVSGDDAHSRAVDDGGRSLRQEPNRPEWTVRGGDTLWDIAARVLGTSDQARIARYWPAIHRANRETIGADPSLIFPGQILRLPPEELDR